MPRKRVRPEKESIVDLFGDVVQDRESYLYSIAEDDEALRLAREPAPRRDPANANAPAETAPDQAAPAPAERPRPISPLGRRDRPRKAPGAPAAPEPAVAPSSDLSPAEGFAAAAPGGAAQARRHLERLQRARLARARAEQTSGAHARDAWPELLDDRGLWSAVTVVHGALSVLSLGLYRPWMKTETRRVLWSNVQADDEPLEYLGTGAQLFRGLMMALILLGGIVALAWVAAAALGLMSLEALDGALSGSALELESPVRAALPLLAAMAAPALIALLLISPLLPLAAFRGRRYRLSRTRWKGVRFGMEGGGWSLMGLGLLWTPLILASAGLLWPVWRWLREARMTRAMRWGGEPFAFEGGPLPLLLHWLPAWGFLAALGALIAVPGARELAGLGDLPAVAARLGPLTLIALALLILMTATLLLANYRAAEVRLTTRARRLGGAWAECDFSVWHLVDSYMAVSRKNLWPGILVWLLIAAVAAIPMIGAMGAELENPDSGGLVEGLGDALDEKLFGGFHSWRAQGLVLMALVIDYFLSAVFTLWLWTYVYQRRRTEHLLASITLRDVHRLDAVRGRARQRDLEAEGMEEALDLFAV
ncbi:DUF898 family protein [Albimonas pacifica]|uniref:DUF898 domain-containing protein n=1 Tax=Albimonas pacifica TaxID=1114924 RepID=A0A1I3LLS1_9RHOB|nr:DUF898 family protein [Albimonas pacifica]SFI85653.1 protein of unknown function [Albimonas pacifica]